MTNSRFSQTFRVLAILLSCVLTGNSVALAASRPLDSAAARHRIEARGLGKPVKVTETDGRVATGVILAIHDDSFQLKTKHAAQPIEVPFSDVARVQGTGMSTGTKIWIGVGVGVAAAILAAAIAVRSAVPSIPSL